MTLSLIGIQRNKMKPADQIPEEWSSLSGLYTAEEADFMNQFLSNCSVPELLQKNSNLGTQSAFWPDHESTILNNNCSYFPAEALNNNVKCFVQGNSSSTTSSNIFHTTSGVNHTSNNPVTNFGYMSLGFSKLGPYSVQENDSKYISESKEILAGKNLQAHKEREMQVSQPDVDKTRSPEKSSGKRSRSSNEVPKNKRNVKSKKNPRSASISTEEEEYPQDQTFSSCCSDDDYNASHEPPGGASLSLGPKDSTALKLSRKSTSSRGPATDPQSVYARRRRERINGRLRILQNLVPNGTKVDISTMLEEAVQYVKFLQLQIKLLSSDDTWMYAPIACNGMNIGLGLNQTTKGSE